MMTGVGQWGAAGLGVGVGCEGQGAGAGWWLVRAVGDQS